MGRFVLFVFVLSVLLAAVAAAVPCMLATLHNYDSSGFACTEGSLMFSSFSLKRT